MPVGSASQMIGDNLRRVEQVPTVGPKSGRHRYLFAEENIFQVWVIWHLPHNAAARKGKSRRPKQSWWRNVSKVRSATSCLDPQKRVVLVLVTERIRAENGHPLCRREHCSIRITSFVVFRQRVTRRIRRQNGLLALACAQLFETSDIPILSEAEVTIDLEVEILVLEQMLLHQGARITGTHRLGVAYEVRSDLARPFAQIEQETVPVFGSHLEANADHDALRMLGLLEQVRDGVLALVVPVAGNRNEDRPRDDICR
mmetsp:Transcript_107483/g.342645  ORF Transcript_107483/g.342645 Transcript_107483/m.342645 type:complete len:257 (+) Transcript_107483:1295-2065(+)